MNRNQGKNVICNTSQNVISLNTPVKMDVLKVLGFNQMLKHSEYL